MTPLTKYQALIHATELKPDSEQARIILQLEHIYHQLIFRQNQRNTYYGMLRRKIKPRPPIHGMYLWGKVGTGKTRLLDLFYECLPTTKIRLHFHKFMQDIHNRLNAIQGEVNPLQKIAREIADSTVVICFDEFIVTNITDAMILSELFQALFDGGVCLIATSNTEPDNLYKNGLQRQRFLAAIELIKQQTAVVHVTTENDYRMRHLEQAGVYYTPLHETTEQQMMHSFNALVAEESISTEPLEVLGRAIKTVRHSEKIIWFEFIDICGRPRSQKDYLELSKRYHTIMISNIPIIQPHQPDLITSLINLIDVLYDAHVRIVVSAATLPNDLYPAGPMSADFRRTQSRLTEMSSKKYWK